MKFQNMIRTQLVLAGLGAALLFAGSASAQEIVNTEFSDGPNVVALAESSPAQPTLATSPMQAASTQVQSEDSNEVSVADSLAGGDSLVQDPTEGAWLTTTLLICMALIAIFALAAAKREDRGFRSRRRSYVSPRAA